VGKVPVVERLDDLLHRLRGEDDVVSVALHLRMHYMDGDREEDENQDFNFSSEQLASIGRDFACVDELLGEAHGKPRKILVVASDSATAGRLAWRHFSGREGLEVLVQRHTEVVHIDARRKSATEKGASMRQALQMWWLLRSVNTLVLGHPAPRIPSGFSISAGLVAGPHQKQVYAESCKPLQGPQELWAGRFLQLQAESLS